MNVDNIKNIVAQQAMAAMLNQSTDNSPAFGILLESLSKLLDGKNVNIPLNGESAVLEDNKNVKSTEVNKMLSNESNINKNKVMNTILDAVESASRKYGIDKKLIMSVIKQESGFNPYAKSSAGAEGLMQLMPGTARGLGVNNSFDVTQNVNGGTKYLKNLLDMYGNSKQMALAAYNAGCGTVRRRGVKSPSDINKLPKETINYVDKVMKNYSQNL